MTTQLSIQVIIFVFLKMRLYFMIKIDCFSLYQVVVVGRCSLQSSWRAFVSCFPGVGVIAQFVSQRKRESIVQNVRKVELEFVFTLFELLYQVLYCRGFVRKMKKINGGKNSSLQSSFFGGKRKGYQITFNFALFRGKGGYNSYQGGQEVFGIYLIPWDMLYCQYMLIKVIKTQLNKQIEFSVFRTSKKRVQIVDQYIRSLENVYDRTCWLCCMYMYIYSICNSFKFINLYWIHFLLD
eukprot:TRINITY_DN16516_c1_g1_i5.p1 TRINITY_DN16516_c1_g1~~TRINITY_DN16516_c1_g1_i5.p1  ORF type:complete len:238 (+),score=1.53 TRINITY_DN16516_c1_g1_i5:28-741(+)